MDRFRGLDYLKALDELAPGWETRGGGEAFPVLERVFVFPTSHAPVRPGAASFASLASSKAPWQPLTERDPQAMSDMIFTSGPTGSPKGVLLTHDMLLRTACGSAYARAFDDGWRVLFRCRCITSMAMSRACCRCFSSAARSSRNSSLTPAHALRRCQAQGHRHPAGADDDAGAAGGVAAADL